MGIHEYSDIFMNTNNHECLGSDLVQSVVGLLPALDFGQCLSRTHVSGPTFDSGVVKW
jgi:hypothetical protein